MFSLVARLSLTDNFSSPMQKVEKQLARNKRMMDQLDTSTGKLGRSTDRASKSHVSFGKSVGSVTRGLGGLKSALFGAVAGYAALETSKKIFNETVMEAAKFEQSSVVIKAMFDDDAASKAYMDLVDKIAITSPILDSQAMYANSKSFITTSKDIKQLEKMWSLAERMAAIDPMQGTEGAVFALKELFSGDAVSMVERFEMPRAIMNDIKKLPLDQQLAKLDEYFNKIGMTGKLINDMGDTTLGKWQQVKEKWNVIMRDMGKPALEPLVGFFDDLLTRFDSEDFARFGKVGGKMIKGIIGGLTDATVDIYDWFTNLVNSEEYKKNTTIYSKVSFVIDDIFKNFKDWLDETGYKKIANVSQVALETLAAGFDAALPAIMPVLSKIGQGIGDGLIAGFNEAVEDSTFLQFFASPQRKVEIKNKQVSESLGQQGAQSISDFTKKAAKKKKAPKKNGGLAYVPYNGYEASLHKGEQVLTRGEADDYRAGKSGKGGVVITGNTFNVREEADIRKIAAKLADLIEASGGAGATWQA